MREVRSTLGPPSGGCSRPKLGRLLLPTINVHPPPPYSMHRATCEGLSQRSKLHRRLGFFHDEFYIFTAGGDSSILFPPSQPLATSSIHVMAPGSSTSAIFCDFSQLYTAMVLSQAPGGCRATLLLPSAPMPKCLIRNPA